MRQVPASSVIAALHQFLYGMYGALRRSDVIEPGAMQRVLREPGEMEALDDDARQWLRDMADVLDQIDNGGRPVLRVVPGDGEGQ